MSILVFCIFFQKFKKLLKGATACLSHLPLQALVATITKLKARAGTIFHNCEKSNDGNPWKR